MRPLQLRSVMLLAFLCLTVQAHANTFYFGGFVTERSGGIAVLFETGDTVSLLFDTPFLQNGDFVTGNDIANLEFLVGGICFSAIASTNICNPGGTIVPAISIETDMMQYTLAGSDPFNGDLIFVGFSPTFTLPLDIEINFDTLSFAVEVGALGSISGCLNETHLEAQPCYQPVPLPGALLMFSSALTMFLFRRNRIRTS